MKRHAAEDCFGVQVAGGYADTMSLTARVILLHCCYVIFEMFYLPPLLSKSPILKVRLFSLSFADFGE